MAARLLAPVTALLLLVALSHVPASAPATLPNLPSEVGAANATPTPTPTSAPSSSSSYKLPTSGQEQDMQKKREEEESEEKKKERQKETEKRRQEEKEMEKECREFAKEHHMVSPTNFTGSYKGMRLDFIHGHNAVRQRYGVPPVHWDKKMAKHARRWANTMRKHCELKHSSTRYGESIYVNPNFWNATAKEAIASWSSEEPFYDKATGTCAAGHSSKDCGHFALLVGKRYQRVGCARSECFKGGVFICCNYWTYDLKDLD